MEQQSRSLKIAGLGVELGLLQKQEKRLRDIIALPMTAPELRAEAQIELGKALEKIKAVSDELFKLELSH